MKLNFKKLLHVLATLLLFVVSSGWYFITPANAGLLSSASVELSDPRPAQTSVSYAVGYTFASTSSIQCIQVKFGTTSALSAAPTGMTTGTSFTLSGGGLTQANWTNYGSTNGTLEIYDATGQAPTATAITITWAGVTNPTANGTFYAQVTSYSTQATSGATCSGQVDQSNVMAVTTTPGVATTVTVDPTISFAVSGTSGAINGGPASNPITTGTSIAFGSVSAGGSATSAAQLLTTSTNAAHGYNIYIRYSAPLTDANSDTIRDQAGTPGAPATFDGSTSQSSFAYTTNSTTVAFTSNKWAGLTTTNTSIDAQTAPQNAATVSVEYQLQLKSVQPPGTYSNVITYTATPTY